MANPNENKLSPESEALLQSEILKRNQIPLSEFNEFKPLFMRTGETELGRQNYTQLAAKYARRVSIFHPVQIIQDRAVEQDPIVVIQTLPANLSRIDLINNIDIKLKGRPHVSAHDVMGAFNNKVVVGSASPLSTDGKAITSITQQYLAKAQDPERIRREAEEFATLTNQLKGKATTTTADFEWK